MTHKREYHTEHSQSAAFDVIFLNPRIDQATGFLILDLPTFEMPLMQEVAMHELEQQMGLERREIEDGIYKMMQGFQAISLGKMFIKARR